MTEEEISKAKLDLQTEVHKRAFYAEGTADFLKKRIRIHNKILTANKYLSCALPIALGGYTSVDSSSDFFELLKYTVGILSTLVLLFSVYLIAADADNKSSQANQSFAFNFLLQTLYSDIARIVMKNKSGDLIEIDAVFRSLTARDESNATNDEKLVSNNDKKSIMFDMLRKHNKECSVCKQVPEKFNKKTGCNNCGGVKK
ncbi:mobilome CxxCx(11)CxxC protein [Pectobacterium versatile]|uniref:mobilome CxxCx(11)CxxC protein n=1 Tax=Pectobacterium versatile TaxID=2488639 RepID=UPI00301713F2